MTKTARKARATAILHALTFGERIEKDTTLFGELMDLLSSHEDWDHKVGVGVAYVEKRQMQFNACFWFVRTDGTSTDIGIGAAINGVPRKQRVCSALRTAIRPQIQEFIAANNVAPGMHVDHIRPFDDIVKEWIGLCRLTWDDIGVVSLPGGEGSVLTDKTFESAWARFHLRATENGGLQAIPAFENLSKGKRR